MASAIRIVLRNGLKLKSDPILFLSVRNVRGSLTIKPLRNLPARNKRRDIIQHQEWNVDDEIDRSLELEYTEDQLTANQQNLASGLFKENTKRNLKQNRDKLKFYIIGQKYFKREKEDNLLTWKAKEQIRYLNKRYPDEWPINRIVSVFPVSKYGVNKLLKYSYTGASEQNIEKHDRAVYRNWKAISERMDEDGKNMEDERLKHIRNAAGNLELPFPKDEQSAQDSYQHTPFSDILKKYKSNQTQLPPPQKQNIKRGEERIDPQDLLDMCFNKKQKQSKFNVEREPFQTIDTLTSSDKQDEEFSMKIDVSARPHPVSRDKVYQKGKRVYDNRGEFLYKIP